MFYNRRRPSVVDLVTCKKILLSLHNVTIIYKVDREQTSVTVKCNSGYEKLV